MDINPSPKVRQAIYVIATVASPVMFYLNQQGVVNNFWLGLFSIVISAVTTLSAVNVSSK